MLCLASSGDSGEQDAGNWFEQSKDTLLQRQRYSDDVSREIGLRVCPACLLASVLPAARLGVMHKIDYHCVLS